MFENKKPAPWLFLIGTLLWTWGFLFLTILTPQHYLQFPTVLLTLLGGLGPLIVSLCLIRKGYWDATLDKTSSQFLLRVFNPKTLKFRWYLHIFVLALFLSVFPAVIESIRTGDFKLLDVGVLTFMVIGVVIGGLEEIGWRAYALEGLQRKVPVIFASLIVGAFWAIWHFPLFFIDGTYQSQLGVGTLAFWSFHAAILIGSPIYAWLYNQSGRIAFAVVFYHALGNLMGELIADAHPVNLFVEAVVAFGLVVLFRQWMMRRRT